MQVNLERIHIRQRFRHLKHHIPKYFFRSEMPARFLLFKNNIKTLNSSVTTGNFFKKEHFLQYSSIAIPNEHNRCLHLRHEKSTFREE